MISSNDYFEWEDENEDHLARHDVDPYEAEEVVTEPKAIVRREGTDRFGNPRFLYLGKTVDGRILVVVIDRKASQHWRIGTARPAKPGERKAYKRRTR